MNIPIFGPLPESVNDVAWIFHESLAATTDMAVLPGVLGYWPLRRTVQVRLGATTLRLPGGTPVLCGLATAIHEISGLGLVSVSFSHQREAGDPHRLGISFQLA